MYSSDALTARSPRMDRVSSMSMDQTASNSFVEGNSSRRSSTRLRIGVAMLLVLLLSFITVDSLGNRNVESFVLKFMGWVEENPRRGMLTMILVYIVATISFVPGSILTFGAGYAFGSAYDSKVEGVAVASTVVFIGASLGSISTFLLGRYLFRSCVVRLASSYPIFQAIDQALQSNGFKIMLLLRLSPLIPYNALDYMSGITAIPLWAYSLALIGLLPGTVALCFIGASASSLTDGSASDSMTLKITTLVAGVVFALGGIWVASYYSKRELEKILAQSGSGLDLLHGEGNDDDEEVHTTGTQYRDDQGHDDEGLAL